MSAILLAPVLFLGGASGACAPSNDAPARAETGENDRRELPAVQNLKIAAPEDALTFARTGAGGARRLLLVLGYANDTVDTVDLSAALGRRTADPVAVLTELGRARLADG